MNIRRITSSIAALILVGGTLVAAAGSASADEVWYQSVGRASAEAQCPVSTGIELEAGWTQWSPSWAQWGNQGKGSFVCDRQITWAITPVSPGCQFANDQSYNDEPFEPTYLQFGSRVLIPAAELNGFGNPDCSGVPFGDSSQDVVFALSQEQAQSLCPVDTVAALGIDETLETDAGPLRIINSSPYIYYCVGDR